MSHGILYWESFYFLKQIDNPQSSLLLTSDHLFMPSQIWITTEFHFIIENLPSTRNPCTLTLVTTNGVIKLHRVVQTFGYINVTMKGVLFPSLIHLSRLRVSSPKHLRKTELSISLAMLCRIIWGCVKKSLCLLIYGGCALCSIFQDTLILFFPIFLGRAAFCYEV